MKKVITIVVSIMALFLLAACGKSTPKKTVQHEEVKATKLVVDTKSKKTNALGNVLIKIETEADTDVSIYNSKTKKTKVITADSEGKVIYNGHLDKKTKSVEFKISATTDDGSDSKTVKLTIKNASDAYKEWKAAKEEEATSSSEESSSEESSSSDDTLTDTDDTAGYDDSDDTTGNYNYGGGNTNGTSSHGNGGSWSSSTVTPSGDTGNGSNTGGSTTDTTTDVEPVAQPTTDEE